MPEGPDPQTEQEQTAPVPPVVLAQDGPAERLNFKTLVADGEVVAEHLEDEEFPVLPSGDSLTDVELEPGTPLPETPVPEIPLHSPGEDDVVGSPTSVRGAGWSSPMASLPSAPPIRTGLGEGGMSPTPKRTCEPNPSEQRPPKQVREEPPKKPRIGTLHKDEIWTAVEKWAESMEEGNPHGIQRLAAVLDWLDGVLDAEQVQKARLAQLDKLWQRHAFVPVHKSEVPKTSKVFHYTWVDKQRDGVHKSRFTCADIKRKYTSAEEAEMRVFVPTPTPESHALLEVSALKHGHAMRTFDIVAAFLIGQDRGAQQGEPVYMRAPPEWRPLFDAWVSEQQWNPETMEEVRAAFSEYMFRLEGNFYGRRTAGAVYRDEFEEILCTKLQPEFEFKRGVRDPCVYRCDKTNIMLVHHVDDVRCAGPTSMLNRLIDEVIPRHCEIQSGPLGSGSAG